LNPDRFTISLINVIDRCSNFQEYMYLTFFTSLP
jgi:hypothetical protein